MASPNSEAQSARAWRVARRQHGVLARRQLLALGFTRNGITHRRKTGRLHLVARGVYSVGRAELSREGRWMAAVLACGENACLSHRSAGALYGICEERCGVIEISVRGTAEPRREGLRVRTRPSLPSQDVGTLHRIPITSPVQTMIDLATELPTKLLARAVNEADKLEVILADDLRGQLDAYFGVPGAKRLVALLDKDTFVLTQEELERLFLPLAREAGLSLPKTKEIVNGFEVDFFWPDLKLVVETDGLRYHRTPSAQAKDARRDQAHTAAGYARLRFTHWQVKYEREYVRRILGETASRLG
jgi:very-short-patch-repair endonuclease/predicted transcriptional regulator of viral defense system